MKKDLIGSAHGAETEMAPRLNRRIAHLERVSGSPRQERNDSLSPKGAGRAGKSIHSAQVELLLPLVMAPRSRQTCCSLALIRALG